MNAMKMELIEQINKKYQHYLAVNMARYTNLDAEPLQDVEIIDISDHS